MEHREFVERQQLCNLRAMRYLSPGTPLPQPATYEERRLLADLVALPDDTDPLPWLRRERGALATRIALRETLRYLRSFVGTAWIESGPDRGVVRTVVDWLRDEERNLSAETLTLAVARLQPLRSLPAALVAPTSEQSRSVPPNAPARLLLELLALPPSADPLAWLEHAHGAYAAGVAFAVVLQQGLPSPQLEIGHPIRVVQLTDVRRDERLTIGIQEIMFGPEGFALAMSVNVPIPSFRTPAAQAPFPPWMVWRNPYWGGFERVADDRGHHYIVRGSQLHTGSHPTWRHHVPAAAEDRPALFERLHMAFYPAVAADAGELLFAADATELLMTPDDPSARPDLRIDPFT